MIERSNSLVEVAAIVSEALRERRIDAILVGGSAITAHDASIYVSRDADFVALATTSELAPIMIDLGFSKRGFHWYHSRSEFTIQFVSGNVAIGARDIFEFADVRTNHGRVRTLRLEDATIDRLLKFLVWNDVEARDVALAILRTKAGEIDVREIVRHLRREAPTPELQLRLRSILRAIERTTSDN